MVGHKPQHAEHGRDADPAGDHDHLSIWRGEQMAESPERPLNPHLIALERCATVRVQSPLARMVNCSIPGRLGVDERVKGWGSLLTCFDLKETKAN
jgi:hypothetical protein